MFQDKSLLAVTEAVKKIWAEALTDKQKKIDKNHNNKIDGQDLAILRKEETKKPVSPFDWKNTPKQTGEKGELSGHTSKKISTGTVYTKKYVKEDDTGYQDRFAVKDGKAVKNNPERGERDQAHHVWADSEEHAVRKHAKMNKVKLNVESSPAKEGQIAAGGGTPAEQGAMAAKYEKKKEVKEEASQAEFTAELKKAQAKSQGKEKADVAKPAVQAVQNEQTHTQVEVFDLNDANGVKRSVIDLEEAKSGYDLYHSMYSGAVQHGLAHHEKSGLTVDPDDYHDKVTVGPKKPSEGKTVSHNIKATNAKGESHMIHMQVHNKGGNKPYELNTYSSKVPKKQVKEEFEQIDENHMTEPEMEKREKIVKSMKKGLAGFKERYGKDAKSVMYATATKQAMKD